MKSETEIDQTEKQLEIYLCDPYKNQSCNKTECYINGGECALTHFKEYAKEDKNI